MFISNHSSWTKQCTSLSPDLLALHLLISNYNFMNKTMHILASRSTGPGPAHWQSQLHKQNNADLCFHDSCPGSGYSQSHDINKNNTNPNFLSSWLKSCHFQLHIMNKTMQNYTSKSLALQLFFSHHTSWTKQCIGKPLDLLVVDLLISKYNFMNKTIQIRAFNPTGRGSVHFQSHDMNKTIQIKASQALGWNLVISNYISLTSKCGSMFPNPLALKWLFLHTLWTEQCRSKPPDLLAVDLLISRHMSLTRQYRPKPPNPLAVDLLISNHMTWTKQYESKLPKLLAEILLFPITFHKQTNADLCVQNHEPWIWLFLTIPHEQNNAMTSH